MPDTRSPRCTPLLLLLATGLLCRCGAAAHACAGSSSPKDAWSCIQQQRLTRVGMVLSQIHDPSNLSSSSTQGYLLQAEEFILYSYLPAQADDLLPAPVQHTSATTDDVVNAHQLQPSRSLLQLSGSVTDTTVQGNQLTRTTARKSSLKDPEGIFQFSREDFSSTSQSLDDFNEEAAKALAAFSPSLAAAAKAFLGGDASSSTDSSDSTKEQQQQMTVPAPTVLPMAGRAQVQSPQPMLRIVGGVEAPTDRKYVCALRAPNPNGGTYLYCGCSLIAPNVVMTAAHCVVEQGMRTPLVEIGRYYQDQANDNGVNDFDRIQCSTSVHHPAWSGTTAQGDIGLCFLESSSRFQPVTLAEAANTKITAGQPLTVLGWGATSEGGNNAASLMTVDVAATDLASCNKAYDNGINGDLQICAGVPEGGKDACQGDSGGPLIIRGNTTVEDVQVGIVSYGIGCARPNMPGVYTDVRAYREWIAQQLLGRGISYTPVTGGFNASQTVTVDQTSACACTSDGKSGSTLLNSRLAGCDQHGLSTGDSEYYCYTQGGTECTTATPSNAYPGAAWVSCTPDVAKSDSSTTTSQGLGTTATQDNTVKPAYQDMVNAPAAQLLGSWLGQWLSGSVSRIGANMTAGVDGSAAMNRTAVASRRSGGLLSRNAVRG